VLLLPLRVAIVATGSGLALLLASLVCVAAGLLPYGPALAETPLVASQMTIPYLVGNTLSSLLATLAVVAIIAYLMTEWRGSLAGLRESEARYRRLTENAFDLIMEVDGGGRTLYASPNHRVVLGYGPGDLVGGVGLDLVHPQDREAVTVAFQRMGEPGWGHAFEMRVRHRDGGWRWFECSANAFRVPSGGTRAVIISRDVTDRKQAQLQQERLEAQMLQTQKLESLGVLAGGIAHDFKNLLVPILGNAHLVKQELAPGSSAAPLVERIATAAVRTSELTDQLLAYAGRGTLTTQPLDMGELLREMGGLLHTAVPRKVELAYEVSDVLPCIDGDAVQLRQVILNLIVNAAEAIGDRPGVVTIGAGTTEVDAARLRDGYLGGELADGSYVYLEVRDDGCGMDEETRSRIFDPFFTTKFTGRGLGLAALLGIVRAHRGAVRVESEPGRGTRFRLLLPVGSGSPAAPDETDPGALPWRGSGTVLVGDDEEGVREFAEYVLRRCGLSVITAEDGEEAVALFRKHASTIVAVVLDMTMPGLGGVEALVEMRRIRPDVRILLSSGYNEADVAGRFRGGGIDGFLQKPYEPEALVRKLRDLLEE
jgi:PAS domain S-box-containing protein